MTARNSFDLYLYVLQTGAIGEYSQFIEDLRFTEVSPGGYGQFECKLKLASVNLLRPELTTFSRIALIDPSVPEPHLCRYLGELSEPELGMNESDGEYVHLVAEGLGATLRDDPDVRNYNAKTAQQIIIDQMTYGNRPNYLVIDPDQSQVFPDNPATTYSPSYDGNTMEEVISDVAVRAGDYSWGVWAHPRNRDAMGFPTGQLIVHQRTPILSTVAYMALDQDIAGWKIVPSIGRAINVVSIGYNDPTQTTAVGVATYTDPRLAANGSQGTAPFRRRKFYRDLAGLSTANKATAQSIANDYGGQWQQPSFTTEVVLRSVRDANGNEIPLWQVSADAMLFLPSLTRRGATFVHATQTATSPTLGVNLFYIRSKEYAEGVASARGGAKTLTLELDNFWDRAETQLARLQLQADTLARLGNTTTGTVQAQGAPFTGVGGGMINPTAGTTAAAVAVGFAPVTLAQVPTSIGSFVAVHVANANTPSASDITVYGFALNWVVPSVSAVSWGVWQFTTVGNCLVEVDEQSGVFAHHCPWCENRHREVHGCLEGCPTCREKATHRGMHLKQHMQVFTDHGSEPGRSRLLWVCPDPDCHYNADHPEPYSESHNTNLGPGDEDGLIHGEHPAEQARLIRAAMRHLGLPTREEVSTP